MSNSTSSESPAALEAALQLIFSEMEKTRTENYSQLSSIAFLLYDIIFRIDKEYEYVWKSRGSIVKYLYFFARYYGLLYNATIFVGMILRHSGLELHDKYCTLVTNIVGLSPSVCNFYWFWAGDIIFTTVVNIILIMRINAMYMHSKKVLAFLISLLATEFGLELYSSIKSGITTAETVFSAPLGMPWPGCFAYPKVKFTLICWIPTAIIATIFFLMTLATMFRQNATNLRSMKRISPLFASFVGDGVIFFFLIFAILMSTMFMTLLFKNALANFLGGWLIAIYSFSACRLILNLREVSQRSLEDTVMLHSTAFNESTIRSPVFASGSTINASRGHVEPSADLEVRDMRFRRQTVDT
ncbi:unnamed protein product [Mycena citricolor]|uniref:DUF6533 domain-containing protein n=1 Tax=Mycena citricolor TaxID=2018698 RepID=A0AAD2HQD0_9AGAR|nr:unnamed protein product [Mycena citricolor]